MRPSTGCSRRGAALFVVTVVVALLGVLAATASRAARTRQVGARRVRALAVADAAVGRLLDSALAAWPARAPLSMAVGERRTLLSGDGGDWLALTRLSADHWRLDAAVHRGAGAAAVRDAASLLVRLDRPPLDARGAVAAAGSLVVGAAFAVTTAPRVGCARAGASADVVARDAAGVTWGGARGTVVEAPALMLPALARIGARADVVLADGARWAPTDDSLRVVYGEGAVEVGPGRGRGVIAAAGVVTLRGPLAFAGLIVAPGGVRHEGGMPVVLRGHLAAGAGSVLAGPGSMSDDPCAARDALDAAARAVPPPVWGLAFEP